MFIHKINTASKVTPRVAVELALFSRTPELGEINPPGEVFYEGYNRVWAWFIDGNNEEPVVFPESTQEEPVYIEVAVAFDLQGKVVGVKKLFDKEF